MSAAVKYLTKKVAEAEVESEKAEDASREARKRADAAFDRVLDARRELAVHMKDRVEKAKENL